VFGRHLKSAGRSDHFLHRYGALLLGCTTVMYEGKRSGHPDAQVLGVIVRARGSRPFSLRRRLSSSSAPEDPDGRLDPCAHLSHVRALFSTASVQIAYRRWGRGAFALPVVDHWGRRNRRRLAPTAFGIAHGLPISMDRCTRAVPAGTCAFSMQEAVGPRGRARWRELERER